MISFSLCLLSALVLYLGQGSHTLCLYSALCSCFLQCFCQAWEEEEDLNLQELLDGGQRENLYETIVSGWLGGSVLDSPAHKVLGNSCRERNSPGKALKFT